MYGCSSATTAEPVLWLSGVSQPFYVENIDFGHGQCAQPVKIGISADGNRKTSGAVSIYFRNVSASPNRKSPLHGPAIDIGSNVIWLWFERISCDANITAAADSDARACILSNPSGAPASGPIYIRDSNFSGAGEIEFYQGSGGMNNFVENVMIESDGNTLCPPVVWVLNSNEAAHVQARNIAQADCPARTTYPAFQNDGSAPAVNMLVEGASGQNNYNVAGHATVLNTSYKSNTQSPESGGQMAFWDDSGSSGQAGRVSGQQDSARRGFGPVAVPYTNLAKSLPCQWTVVTGTVATGIAAPDGTANAARLSAPRGFCDVRPYQNPNFSARQGDWFIGGVWARADTPTHWGTTQKLLSIGLQSGTFTQGGVGGYAPLIGDGEWEWIAISGRSQRVRRTRLRTCRSPAIPLTRSTTMVPYCSTSGQGRFQTTKPRTCGSICKQSRIRRARRMLPRCAVLGSASAYPTRISSASSAASRSPRTGSSPGQTRPVR